MAFRMSSEAISCALVAAVTGLAAGEPDAALAVLGKTLADFVSLAEGCGQTTKAATVLGRFQEVYQFLKRERLASTIKTQVKDESERLLRDEMPKNWHKLGEASCVVLEGLV